MSNYSVLHVTYIITKTKTKQKQISNVTEGTHILRHFGKWKMEKRC